jgi:hypothetical protein
MRDSQIVARHLWRLTRDGKRMICPKSQTVQAAARAGARRERGELREKRVRRSSHDQRLLAVRNSVQTLDTPFSSPPEVRLTLYQNLVRLHAVCSSSLRSRGCNFRLTGNAATF